MEDHLIAQRKEKIRFLEQLGINPYPYRFAQKNYAYDILSGFKHLKNGEKSRINISVAGRITALRVMGKVSFGNLQDKSGRIQFYIKEEDIGKSYNIFKKLDIGDIIGINGFVFKTH